MSVVPVAGLTYYSYVSNAKALRATAQHEAQFLADELTQRMQVVTGQLTERVGHLMDLANAQEAAAYEAEARSAEAASATAAAETASNESVAELLSQVAMLVNNVEFRDPFGRARGVGPGRGREGGRFGPAGPNGGRNPGPPPGPAAAAGQPVAPAPAVAGPTAGQLASPATSAMATTPSAPDSAAARPGGQQSIGARNGGRRSGNPGAPPPGPPGTPFAAVAEATDPNKLTVDLTPIRMQIFQELASQEQWATLTETERQRIRGEVQQRMLGIQMGIEMGAAEVQKRVLQAQQAASEKAKEAAAAASSRPPSSTASARAATPTRKTSTLTNGRLDVKMERDGEIVNQVNAEVNLPNLLNTVFSTTRRDRGELPFAVAKDGKIFTPAPEDQARVEALGTPAKPETEPGTAMVGEWVVVTAADPTGLGLKLGIARPVGDSLKELRRASVRNAAIGLGTVSLALIAILPLSGRLTRQLSTLSDAVDRLAQGDYRARVDIQTHDEFGKLARAFNQMAADVEQHQRDAVEQERIKRELELGRQIQHDMLPHVPLRIGLTEVKGVSVPAKEVGGDFFNYFQVAEGKVALLVGDVSGKGVGAALLMANIQASLRTRLALGQDLSSLARELDKEVGSTTPDAVYATLFVAILDLNAHELRYVNAGHNPQYVLRPNGTLEVMPSTGFPVGLMSGHEYVERRVEVSSGDVLFFYTDGCVEMENAEGEMFGNDRLEARLKAAAVERADDVLVYVESDVARFRGNTEAFDDATMMAVRVG
jgi:sigma-B regulation protein RsbU (phosphoserine phosphatase)